MVWLNIKCTITVHVFFISWQERPSQISTGTSVLIILCLSVCMYVKVLFVCVTITVSVHLGILPLRQVDFAFTNMCVFTLEYCLCNLRAGNPSDCGRDSPPSQPAEEIYFKTMLLFTDLDFHFMPTDKFS